VYQDFKVTKVELTSGGFGNQKYVLCDFKYILLTGAGFEVDRRGVASITSEGDAVEVLWCASTRQRYVSVRRIHGMKSSFFGSSQQLTHHRGDCYRYKNLEATLRDMAGSFRCYADGLKFSGDMV
jgi:hypothetical protein